jgi:hypothetical protein
VGTCSHLVFFEAQLKRGIQVSHVGSWQTSTGGTLLDPDAPTLPSSQRATVAVCLPIREAIVAVVRLSCCRPCTLKVAFDSCGPGQRKAPQILSMDGTICPCARSQVIGRDGCDLSRLLLAAKEGENGRGSIFSIGNISPAADHL